MSITIFFLYIAKINDYTINDSYKLKIKKKTKNNNNKKLEKSTNPVDVENNPKVDLLINNNTKFLVLIFPITCPHKD